MIVAFCDGVVEDDCVGAVIATNGNAVKGFSLGGGPRLGVVSVMIEVAHRKEYEPGFGLWLGSMDEFVRSGKLAAKTPGDLV